MPWIILVLTALLVPLLCFGVGVLAAGFFLLVILNGFTGRQAQPILLGYLVVVTAASFLLSMGFDWLVASLALKKHHLPRGKVIAISLGGFALGFGIGLVWILFAIVL